MSGTWPWVMRAGGPECESLREEAAGDGSSGSVGLPVEGVLQLGADSRNRLAPGGAPAPASARPQLVRRPHEKNA